MIVEEPKPKQMMVNLTLPKTEEAKVTKPPQPTAEVDPAPNTPVKKRI
jgi:hypothetical protein